MSIYLLLLYPLELCFHLPVTSLDTETIFRLMVLCRLSLLREIYFIYPAFIKCQASNYIRDILKNKIEFVPSPHRVYRRMREISAAVNMQSSFRVQF